MLDPARQDAGDDQAVSADEEDRGSVSPRRPGEV
jgi:hypothetical protein